MTEPLSRPTATPLEPPSEPVSGASVVSTRVWDLPTRLFHWALAVCVLGSVVSAKIGGNAMVWHLRFGLAVLALLAFRVVWGFVGGHWSRFASFLFSPFTLLRYLRGKPRPGEVLDAGHSPTGALSVFALLGLLALQVGTGLVADDEIATTGPLVRFVDSATSLDATAWHKGYGQWIILGLIGLHLAAIAWSVAKSRGLLAAMIHGDKTLPPGQPAARDGVSQRVLALVLLALALALAFWVSRLAVF